MSANAQALLDTLFSDSGNALQPAGSPSEAPGGKPLALSAPSSPSIAKVRYTHEAMIDLIIANPAISQNDLAAHFGYSASWISTIMGSDAFQVRFAERTAQLVDPVIKLSVEERFKGMVLRSMEILAEKLSKPSHMIPDNLALRTLELGSRALGYGARPEAVPVKVDVHQHLNILGENLTKLLERKKSEVGVVDAEVQEITKELLSSDRQGGPG